MADLKFKVIGDLRELERQLSKTLDKKIKLTAEGGGAAGGKAGDDKEEKKQTGLLSTTVGILGAIALVLKNFTPIMDRIKIGFNLFLFAFLKVSKWLRTTLPEILSNVWTNIVEWLKVGWEFIKELPGKIWEFIKNLAVDIWDLLKIGFDFIKETLITWFTKAIDWIKGLAGAIWDKLKAGFDFVVEIFKTVGGFLREKLIFIGGKIKELVIRIKERLFLLGKKIGEKLTELRDRFKEIIEGVKTKIGELKDKVAGILTNIKDRIFNLARDIADAIKSKITGFFGGGGSETNVGDAIIRPNGDVIRTDPRDTLIATQNPEALGGGGSKIVNIYGSTNQEIIDIVKRELGVDVNRSTRF